MATCSAGSEGARRRGQAPGKAWGWKGILPASLSGGTELSVSCTICPAPRKRNFSHYVLQLFGIEYRPASPETDSESILLSPAQPGVAVSRKLTKSKCRTGAGPGAAFFLKAVEKRSARAVASR